MSGDELRDGIDGAAIVICNDYEFELIRQKTGLDEDAVLALAGALIVTRGEQGCTVRGRAIAVRRPGRAAARASSIRPASATRSAAGC